MILTNLALILAASVGFAADTSNSVNRVIAANSVIIDQMDSYDDASDYMPEKEALALLKAELSEDDLNIEW